MSSSLSPSSLLFDDEPPPVESLNLSYRFNTESTAPIPYYFYYYYKNNNKKAKVPVPILPILSITLYFTFALAFCRAKAREYKVIKRQRLQLFHNKSKFYYNKNCKARSKNHCLVFIYILYLNTNIKKQA